MKHFYFIGEKVAYLFHSEDGKVLKTDIVIDKNHLQEGMELMRKAYNGEVNYEELKHLQVSEDILTLKDFEDIVETPNEKNYDKYRKIISIDLYEFLKKLKKEEEE